MATNLLRYRVLINQIAVSFFLFCSFIQQGSSQCLNMPFKKIYLFTVYTFTDLVLVVLLKVVVHEGAPHGVVRAAVHVAAVAALTVGRGLSQLECCVGANVFYVFWKYERTSLVSLLWVF